MSNLKPGKDLGHMISHKLSSHPKPLRPIRREIQAPVGLVTSDFQIVAIATNQIELDQMLVRQDFIAGKLS